MKISPCQRIIRRALFLWLLLGVIWQPGLVVAEALPVVNSPEPLAIQRRAIAQAPKSTTDMAMLDITVIAAGEMHTCALTKGGGVRCWGDNEHGQLGDGGTIQRSAPVNVVGLNSEVMAIATGNKHACALTSSGGVKCWGANWYGQLGDGTTTHRSTPVDVVGLSSGVTAIATGNEHTCAVTTVGGVKCWGHNYLGELGDGTTTTRRTPVDVSNLDSTVVAITAGQWYTCALTTGGGVKCWGNNWAGKLGDGTSTDRLTPVDVAELGNGVTAIVAGGNHTCALTSGGGVKCWGSNRRGQVGDGTNTDRSTPTDVMGLESGVTAIAVGGQHTCALTVGGGDKCWGINRYGQLGDDTTTHSNTPVDVMRLGSGVTAITAGISHTCAVTSNGGKCWGDNEYGQLGDGTTTRRSMPIDVSGLGSDMNAITAGQDHTCVVAAGGGVKCWGSGPLGDGTYTQRSTPVDVVGLNSGVIAITAGVNHTCALTSDGAVKCWGANWLGQLGNGTTESHSTPVGVSGLGDGVTAITAGSSHTCALTVDGGVKCWGYNGSGRLGDGTTENRNIPVDVVGLGSGVTAIAAGSSNTCGLLAGGGAKCWGYNRYGQLGDGTTTDRNTPVDVVGLSNAVTVITAGRDFTCALTAGGEAKCWGWNYYGQLGDNTTTHRSTPVDVSGLGSGVTAITAGWGHTCAATTGGKGKCWGWNYYGQLGDSTYTQRSTPVDVSGLGSNVTAIVAGKHHTCTLLSGSGRAKCWGADHSGQLGIGTILQRLTPVDVIESAPSYLTANYGNGRTGSYFTITGWHFPPGAEATLSVNGEMLTTSLPVNHTGSFIIFLDTSIAEAGGYAVTVNVAGIDASTGFLLAEGATLRPQEGGGQTFVVPSGIAFENFMYLPLAKK